MALSWGPGQWQVGMSAVGLGEPALLRASAQSLESAWLPWPAGIYYSVTQITGQGRTKTSSVENANPVFKKTAAVLTL